MSNFVNDNAIPPSLIRMVSKVNNYKKNTVRLLPESGQSSAAANGTIRVKLPNSIICDLGSLVMECVNTFTSTNGDVVSPDLESYVQRLSLSASGEEIFSISNYGDVWTVLKNASMTTQMQRCHHISGGELGAKSEFVNVRASLSDDDSTKETSASAVNTYLTRAQLGTVGGTTVTFVAATDIVTFSAATTVKVGDTLTIDGLGSSVLAVAADNLSCTIDGLGGANIAVGTDNWHVERPTTLVKRDTYKTFGNEAVNCSMTSFLSLSDLGWVDLSLLSQLSLEIQLAGNNVLCNVAAPFDASYALTEIQFNMKTLQFPQWSQSLFAMVSPDPSTGVGGEVSFAYKRYQTFQFGKTQASSHDLKFSIATGSLDKLWLTAKQAAYATPAAYVPGNAVPYYTFSDTDTGIIRYIQAFVAESPYPNYRIDNRFGYAEALLALEQHNNLAYDNLVESKAEFSRSKWSMPLVFEDLSAGSANQISGVNTLGMASNLRMSIENGDGAQFATANGAFYVIAEVSSILHVSAGRIMRLEY